MKKGTALDVKESTQYTVYSTQYTVHFPRVSSVKVVIQDTGLITIFNY